MNKARAITASQSLPRASQRKVDEALAAIMANTWHRARRLNALEVAEKIEFARQALGNLQNVAERTVLSYEMIRQIHSALKCTAWVKNLAKSGRLSSFDILHRLSKLSPEDQNAIATAVVNEEVDSDDVRGLVALRRELPSVSMVPLINRIKASRNIKHHIAYFSIPPSGPDARSLHRRFGKALGQNGIVSVTVKGCLGKLTMTPEARRRLQERAREMATTKRLFIDQIVTKGMGRHG